jgi:diguanylate cyclase (GGDEF)-like protein
VVVAVDYVTTYELGFTSIYLFIVLLVTWNCGWEWGLAFVVMSFAAQVEIGDLGISAYSNPIYHYIRSANRLISFLIALGLTTQLKILHLREKEAARLDHLTGISNQKGFYEALGVEIARHRREQIPMSVAYLDCDDFKQVNDRSGHKAGDRLLENLAQLLKANLRKTDVIGRLGGDEFAIVLANTDKDRAVAVIDKLRRELDALMTAHGWPVTFSIGVGVFARVPVSEDEIISFTDKLMYRVKASGKKNILTEEFAGSGARGSQVS